MGADREKPSSMWLSGGRSALAVLGGALIVLAVFWAHLLLEIAQIRNSTLAAAKRDAANLALAAQELTSRLFLSAEHHMYWIRQEFDRQGKSFDFVTYYHSGQSFKEISTYAGVYNAKGDVLLSSLGASDPRNNIGDRDYFKKLREMDGDRLIIAKPLLGKTSGKWIIPVAIRRTTAGGEFAGAVVAGISVDHILDFYRAFNLGRQGSLSLLDLEGTVMARRFPGKSVAGENFRNNEVFTLATQQAYGTFETVSLADGVRQIIGYRLLGQMPMLVAVGLSVEDVLADFATARQSLLWQGAGVSFAILLLAGVAIFLLRRQDENLALVKKANLASREAYHRLVDIIDGASEQIAALDLQFRFLVFNKRYAEEFERLFGKRIDIGQSLIDALSHLPEEQKKALEIWGRALDGENFTTVREFGAPNLSRRIFEMVYSPLRNADGVLIGAINVTRDVTEQVGVECELKRSSAEMERLASVVSHDILNGLRKISSSIGQIKERHSEPSESDLFISSASHETKHLLHLAEGLSDYIHLQKKNAPFSQIDLKNCCNEALSGLRDAIRFSDAEIIVGALPSVIGDSAQLSQLFHHLIRNSLHNRRPGVTPSVHVSSERRNGSWVIGVHDNGRGIKPADLPKLFIAFQQIHTDRDQGQLGLGLAICRSIIERHGGRIWAESLPNQGSSFYFSLPVSATETNKAAQ
jgi:signal transduction histidine kinase